VDTDTYVIHKRDAKGLLANMWEFPNIEWDEKNGKKEQQLIRYMKEVHNLDVEIVEYLTNIQHIFTHLIWDIDVFIGVAKGVEKDLIRTTNEEVIHYAFPVSHQKIYQSLRE